MGEPIVLNKDADTVDYIGTQASKIERLATDHPNGITYRPNCATGEVRRATPTLPQLSAV